MFICCKPSTVSHDFVNEVEFYHFRVQAHQVQWVDLRQKIFHWEQMDIHISLQWVINGAFHVSLLSLWHEFFKLAHKGLACAHRCIAMLQPALAEIGNPNITSSYKWFWGPENTIVDGNYGNIETILFHGSHIWLAHPTQLPMPLTSKQYCLCLVQWRTTLKNRLSAMQDYCKYVQNVR